MNLIEPIDLIVLDMDRTTLTNDYRVVREVVDGISRAKSAGLRVVPATARSPQALFDISRQLDLLGLSICLNGAWTGEIASDQTAKPLSRTELDRGNTLSLIGQAERLGLNPCWFTQDAWYALSSGPLVEREEWATGTKAKILETADGFEAPILKVLCLEDPSTGSTIEDLRKQYSDRFVFTRSDKYLVEVTAIGASKQTALAQLSTHLGVSQNRIAAIGDSENDLEMIRWAGLGIAVANAQEAVLGAADQITKSNEEAGVAVAIDEIIAANRDFVLREGA